VTAVLDGKRVIGMPREIREVRNTFADGNGRMGRLWQTLIRHQWKPIFAWLPVETVIRDRQEDYYRVLAEADNLADATPFIKFRLE
jgi:Fic family protein